MKKLHVGSGPHYVEGWVNLDLNNFDGWAKQPDVLGDVFDMHMFEDDTFDRLYCGHLLEHLAWERVPEALREMSRVCKPDAVMCFVGPCLDKAKKTNQPQWLIDEIAVGWDDPTTNPDFLEGFPHLWSATTDLTKEALELGGLVNIKEHPINTIKLPEWANTAPADPRSGAGMWQVAFTASPNK